VRLPATSRIHLLWTRGRGVLARVDGADLVVRRKNAGDAFPVLTIRAFSFDVDLGTIFDSPETISQVVVTGMNITIPPKGGNRSAEQTASQHDALNVRIREVIATDSQLKIMPAIAGKPPLTFDVARLHLESAGKELQMKYDAVLTNPRPVGLIHSNGTFGPWSAKEPGDTPLSGSYTFDHADLSIFSAIAGILRSTGEFEGTLSAITARGNAVIPDFRLKSAGHPVPLSASFEVLVDGGNGNTILKPVHATLGSTQFTTSGGVVKKNGDLQRSIMLDVTMPAGNLRDVLRLAMKSPPVMEGRIALKSKISIPPLTKKVAEKLLLDGQFTISDGRFLQSGIQSKIDGLSRRGQGEPGNKDITEVFSNIAGNFRMENQTITFRPITFTTPGATVKLTGAYNLAQDMVDFHGSLALDAKVSQTMTGWKRWALKPVDPLFAKNGAGTFLRIKIDGSSGSPNIGLDHSKPETPLE
jgi:AsmA-like C-terminal region